MIVINSKFVIELSGIIYPGYKYLIFTFKINMKTSLFLYYQIKN